MIFPPGLRVILCTAPTDMRCGYDSLAGRVRNFLHDDPLCGTLFVFRSRDATRIKILYWDKDGLAIWMKRLEKGSFRFPEAPAQGASSASNAAHSLSASASSKQPTTCSKRPIPATDLAMILAGMDLNAMRRHKRFTLPTSA